LTNKTILVKSPGTELYEITAVNVLFVIFDNENYTGPLLNNSCIAFKFWTTLLHHNNSEMLSVIWPKLISLIRKTNSIILYDIGFMTCMKILNAPITNPDLQEAVFEFMYKAIIDMDKNAQYTCRISITEDEKFLKCVRICKKVSLYLQMKAFYPRGNFFKLFGKTFGIMLQKYNVK
jgi:hypothetical protein